MCQYYTLYEHTKFPSRTAKITGILDAVALPAYLGVETTRGWSRNTVLRVAPCLFGLYTVVALLYAELPARYTRVRVVDSPGKRDVTFSDAITAVRHRCGWSGFLQSHTPNLRHVVQK